MALSAQIALSITAHEKTAGDLSKQMRVTPATYAMMLGDGTAANQAQVVWSDSGEIPDGNEALHQFESLSDDRGTVSMSAVKVLYVRNSGSLPLTVAPYFWNGAPWSSSIDLEAGGVVVMVVPTAGGWSAAGSGAGILVANQNGSAVPYQIMLIGEGTIS